MRPVISTRSAPITECRARISKPRINARIAKAKPARKLHGLVLLQTKRNISCAPGGTNCSGVVLRGNGKVVPPARLIHSPFCDVIVVHDHNLRILGTIENHTIDLQGLSNPSSARASGCVLGRVAGDSTG